MKVLITLLLKYKNTIMNRLFKNESKTNKNKSNIRI